MRYALSVNIPYWFGLVVILICCSTIISGQEVNQLTTGESEYYDSNREKVFTLDSAGHYLSYLDDKIFIYNLDTDVLIYESDFKLCDRDIIEWFIVDSEIVYISRSSILIVDVIDGSVEEVFFDTSQINKMGDRTLGIIYYNGILDIHIYPGSEEVLFDVSYRSFIDESIFNTSFTTDNFYYHTKNTLNGLFFLRYSRSSGTTDTILSNYTSNGNVRSDDKHYFITEEFPIMVIDQNDSIRSYDIEHGRISSGTETSKGTIVLAEGISGGTVIHVIDKMSTNLIDRDTVWSEKRITIIDSHQDNIYVEFSTQYETNYGLMEPPFDEVDILVDSLLSFTEEYIDNDLFVVVSSDNSIIRHLDIIEKDSNSVINLSLNTSYGDFFRGIVTVLNTSEGIRFVVSEPKGRAVYRYDRSSNSLILINLIENERGLGTRVQKNGDSYLISDEHTIHDRFEYLHPENKGLLVHEVDGIIHGDVIPYNGMYFYIRNKNYRGFDENFILDFVMFDPSTDEITLLESDFSYPKINNSFGNINHTNYDYGFVPIFKTNLVFDLNKQKSVFVNQTTGELIRNINYETKNYYYSKLGFSSFRIDKSNLGSNEEIFSGSSFRFVKVDDSSFVVTFTDKILYVTDTEVERIDVPSEYDPYFVAIFKSKLFLGKSLGTHTSIHLIDFITKESTEFIVEGRLYTTMGDYFISLNTVTRPYELVSTNIVTGSTFYTTSNYPNIALFINDSLFYRPDLEQGEISILSPKWEKLGTINADVIQNSSLQRISSYYQNPVVFRVQKPKLSSNSNIKPDYSLLMLDTEGQTLTEYFGCDSDLRFRKLFELDSISTMLLRTEDQGYQVHEVVIPNYSNGSVKVKYSLSNSEIEINPNPTNGVIRISGEIKSTYLYNISGQLIDKIIDTEIIDLGRHKAGMYFLKLMHMDGESSIHKVVKTD